MGGAIISSSYVLLRTPRSGKENQEFIKDFTQTTQTNIDQVANQAADLQHSLNNLTTEIKNIQQYFVPDILEIAEDFKAEATVSSRRIQEELKEMEREINQLNVANNSLTNK